jgi:hypothetical protein
MQNTAAAWLMTSLTPSTVMVALVPHPDEQRGRAANHLVLPQPHPESRATEEQRLRVAVARLAAPHVGIGPDVDRPEATEAIADHRATIEAVVERGRDHHASCGR